MIKLIIILNILLATTRAEHHLSIVLLTAPKKIPMLTYTIEYFLHSYEYNNGGIIIDGFFMGKGCDCDHPEVDDAVKLLNSKGIPAYDVKLKNDIVDSNSDIRQKLYNFFSSIWYDHYSNFYYHIDHDLMIKDTIITYYFDQLIEEMERKTPNYEYMLFLEDDVAFNKDFFLKLSKEMDISYDGELLMKLAFTPDYRIPELHWKLPRLACVWGFWGMLYTPAQLQKWKKFGKFQTYSLTGDLYQCELYRMLDESMRLVEISYHFGRDKNIKPRDERFW